MEEITGLHGAPATAGALLPIFNIADRAVIAYEVISRPMAGANSLSIVRYAFDAATHTTPALLLVPMFGDTLEVPGAELREAGGRARRHCIGGRVAHLQRTGRRPRSMHPEENCWAPRPRIHGRHRCSGVGD